MDNISNRRAVAQPPLYASLLPVALLLITLIAIICTSGADVISGYSPYALLGASALAVAITYLYRCLNRKRIKLGFLRSAGQILPAVAILLCISLVATTWMLSGVVPTLIDYGLATIDPTFFLVTTCAVCAVISVLTGSSWSTIATIGVAFMGIGSVMGYSSAMVAGAVISGAYFGDKMSPLSDTTVLASSACNVDLFRHIRYMMLTSAPAMAVALGVFLLLGLFTDTAPAVRSIEMIGHLQHTFNITPWTMLIPAFTITVIAMRLSTIATMGLSALAGFIGMFVFQPQIIDALMPSMDSIPHAIGQVTSILWNGSSLSTGHGQLDGLVATSGVTGMLPTIFLVLTSMVFGAAMIGTGMLSAITHAITRHLRKRTSIVGATVSSGLFLNACTADQYLSLIIGGNMYRNVYRRFGLEPRLLSRTMEDSVSVTSVLIPWNSCGITQSTVLGVATISYLPFCIFNIMSPIATMIFAWTGYRIRTVAARLSTARA